MGKSGTDVARETAELIVTDDNFSSIVAGVEEGRIAYANVRKVIFLLISTGAAEIVLFTLAQRCVAHSAGLTAALVTTSVSGAECVVGDGDPQSHAQINRPVLDEMAKIEVDVGDGDTAKHDR